MPKFLDAPSWYDSAGNLQTIQGNLALNMGYGSISVPYVQKGATVGTVGYILHNPPSSGQVCCGTSGRLDMTSGGSTGDILTKTQNGAPTWSSRTMLHIVQVEANSCTGFFNIYNNSSAKISNKVDFISSLNQMYGSSTTRHPVAGGGVLTSGGYFALTYFTLTYNSSSDYTLRVYISDPDDSNPFMVNFVTSYNTPSLISDTVIIL